MANQFSYYGGVSGFVAGCVESQNYFDKLSVQPTNDNKQCYDDLICGLVTNGLYTKIDRLFMFAGDTAQAALVSLVNPTSAVATEVNTPLFTPYKGYKTNGSRTAYINTNWSVNEGGNNYAATDAFAGVYVRKWVNSNNSRAFGKDNGGNTGLKMNPRRADTGQINGQINNTNTNNKNIGDPEGLLLFDRLLSVENCILNGVNKGGLGTAGGVLNGGDVYVLGNNSGGSISAIQETGSQTSAFISGEHLTDAEHATLSTLINTYLQCVFITSCTESQDYFDALTVLPNAPAMDAIDEFICGTVTDGVYPKLDRFLMFASETSEQALTSMVNPLSTLAVAVNTPVFTALRGYQTNVAQTAYIDTNFDGAVDGVKWVPGDGSVGANLRVHVPSGGTVIGAQNNLGQGTLMQPQIPGSLLLSGKVQHTGGTGSAVGSGTGTSSFQTKGNTTSREFYKDGALLVTVAAGATHFNPSFNFYSLCLNSNGSAVSFLTAGDEVVCVWIGGELTATEQADMHTRINTYKSAVGA